MNGIEVIHHDGYQTDAGWVQPWTEYRYARFPGQQTTPARHRDGYSCDDRDRADPNRNVFDAKADADG